MTQKLTSRGKLLSRMKQSGYDATERQSYWKAEQEKLKAEHEKLTKEIEARKLKEEAPVHNEFKKAMGVGSYGDFAKRHGVQKTKTIISSLRKERDEIIKMIREYIAATKIQKSFLGRRIVGKDVHVSKQSTNSEEVSFNEG